MSKLYRNWHIVFFIIISLTPLIWFFGKEGVIVNGVDTNFPLAPAIWLSRRFFVWNETANAGVSFASASSGIFFHSIQFLGFVISKNLQTAQIVSFVFWFGLIVFSAFAFSRVVLPNNKLSQVVFVLLYSSNIYLFNTWENVKVANIALVVGLPLFLAIYISLVRGQLAKYWAAMYFLMASIVVSGSGINPAYFIVTIFGVFLFGLAYLSVLLSEERFKIVIFGFGLFLAVFVLANFYWILPTLQFLFFSSRGISNLSDIGFASWLDSLSRNTSLVNVLRLQGSWDWYEFESTTGAPLYLPYVVNYFSRLPFIIFSFILPAISILSLGFRSRKFNVLYIYFGILLILGVFLGAGSHPPTGALFLLFSEKLPFFSFFRSPWYIFTPLTTLSLAGLAGLLITTLLDKFGNWRLGKKYSVTSVIYLFVAVFIIGHLLYSYPLFTGKVFRPSRSDGFYVRFPNYVWDTKNWLETQPSFPRVVSYPDDDLESFSWGYRGVETILGLLSKKEFLSPSFSNSNPGLVTLHKEFYSRMKKKEYESALAILPWLGVDTVFNKRDQHTLATPIDETVDQFVDKTSFGKWDFLRISGGGVDKFYIPSFFIENSGDDGLLASVVGEIPQESSVFQIGDTQIKKVKELGVDLSEGKMVQARHSQDGLGLIESNQVFVVSIVETRDFLLLLEKRALENPVITIDSKHVLPLVGETERFFKFGPLEFISGEHEIQVTFEQTPSIISALDFSKEVDLSNLRGEDLPENLEKTIAVFNEGKEKTNISLPVENFDPYSRYMLIYDHKYYYGESAVFEGLQVAPGAPIKTFNFKIGDSLDWIEKHVLVEPVPTNSNFELNIVLRPDEDENRSKTFIENIRLQRLFDNNLYLISQANELKSQAKVTKISKLSPVEYLIEVDNGQDGFALNYLANYDPGWVMSSANSESDEPIHFKVNGYANGWYIPGGVQTHQLRIYYQPQEYFKYGGYIALGTAIVVASWFFYKLKTNV